MQNKIIIAMGMMAENMQRQALGESMAYTEKDFVELLEEEDNNYSKGQFDKMMGMENGIDDVFKIK